MKVLLCTLVVATLVVSNVCAEITIMDQERSVSIAYPGCDLIEPLPDEISTSTDFEPWLSSINSPVESCATPEFVMERAIRQNSTMGSTGLFAAGMSKQELIDTFPLSGPAEARSVYKVVFIVSESTVFSVSGITDLLVQNLFYANFTTGLELRVIVDKVGVGYIYEEYIIIDEDFNQYDQVSKEIDHVGLLSPGIYEFIVESRNVIIPPMSFDEDEMVSLELSYVLTLDFSTNSSGNCDGDFDGDGDVDLRDYAVFQSLFSGPLD